MLLGQEVFQALQILLVSKQETYSQARVNVIQANLPSLLSSVRLECGISEVLFRSTRSLHEVGVQKDEFVVLVPHVVEGLVRSSSHNAHSLRYF